MKHFKYTPEILADALSIFWAIDNIPESDWPKLWCDFNSWKIPEQLIDLKPEWWHINDTAMENHQAVSRPSMNKIEAKCGRMALSREWNRERMTDAEFDIFWNDRDRWVKEFIPLRRSQ